jgi:hypothetical protein
MDIAAAQQRGEPVAGRAAARPWLAGGIAAFLVKFGSIQPEQADARIVEHKAVPIGHTRPARDRGRRRIEPGGDHCQHREQGNDQDQAAAAGKKAITSGLPPQDFTTR